MILNKKQTRISGCFELQPKRVVDVRGVFVKTFHKDVFEEQGIGTYFEEDFYSVSKAGVLRGLHFQLPPYDHDKIVYCVGGSVLDVVVDVRVGSPSYGLFEIFRLSADLANILYIPRGVAHGFYTLAAEATMMYKVSKGHSSDHDAGILWNSLGIPWPDVHPTISPRDAALPAFSDFRSPFTFEQ